MNIEEMLTRSARELSGRVRPPAAPDPGALAARATAMRRRRRTAVAATVAAAAVAATVVLGPIVVGGRSGTEPADRPAPERLGDVPAWVDSVGDIHAGPLVVDVPDGLQVQRFTVTATGVLWIPYGGVDADGGPAGGAALRYHPVSGAPVELAPDAIFVAADPDGDNVVWVTADGVMVTYDVVERRVLHRRDATGITREVTPMTFTTQPLLEVDDDSVVYEVGDQVRVVDLVTGTDGSIPDVVAADLLDHAAGVSAVATTRFRDGGAGGARSLARIEFRGPAGTVPAEHDRLFTEGRLSPDGRWFVTSTGYEAGLRAVVLDTATGREVPVDLPDIMRGDVPDPWGWTGRDVLVIGMVETGPTRRTTWTCRLTDRSCEELGSGPGYVIHPS